MPETSEAPPPAVPFASWRDDARDWARGRRWEWRLPLLFVLAYTALRGLTAPTAWSWWAGITLGVHELGHIVFAPFGRVVEAAGGSIAQVLAPLIVMWLMRRQRDWFGIAVGATWLAYSLANLATYIADARAQALPLVGLTDQPEHDWNFLLGHFGVLGADQSLARVARLLSAAVLGGATVLGVWVCAQMRTQAVRRIGES